MLASQKFKDTIPQFLASKINGDKMKNLLRFRVLWNTRSSIWHLVDKRVVAKSYKLPRLEVNISYPNPSIGEMTPGLRKLFLHLIEIRHFSDFEVYYLSVIPLVFYSIKMSQTLLGSLIIRTCNFCGPRSSTHLKTLSAMRLKLGNGNK